MQVTTCSPSELAYEIDDLQAGAFTHALLEGLRIRGENNCATVERLYQHLRYRVPELNQRYRKPRQTPYAITEPATKLHLILLPRQATLQDVLALKNDALEAEAENDLDLADQLWIRVLAVSPADRQAVDALRRIAIKRVGQVSSSSPVAGASTAGTRSVTAPTSEPRVPSAPTFEFDVVTIARIEKTGFFGQGGFYGAKALPACDVLPFCDVNDLDLKNQGNDEPSCFGNNCDLPIQAKFDDAGPREILIAVCFLAQKSYLRQSLCARDRTA